jgi:MFS family permease
MATYLLKEKTSVTENSLTKRPSYNFFSFFTYWRESSSAYRKLVIGLIGFALVNSSDIFLLLMMKANGLSDIQLILVYIFYNIIYAFTAYPLGILADRIGLWETLIIGLFLFALVYAGMAFGHSLTMFFLLFAAYGIYAAATEGVSKALISNLSERKDTATAIGTFSAFNSLAALLSSSIAGFIWFTWGARPLFLLAALGCLMVIGYLIVIKRIVNCQ